MQPAPPFEPKRISQKQRKAEVDLIRIYDTLASAEFYVNNVTEAIQLEKHAIQIMQSHPDAKPELLAEKHESLARYLMEDDQWDEAGENIKQAIELRLQANRPSVFIKLAENFALLCIIENKRAPSFNFNVSLKKFKKRIQHLKTYAEEWEWIENVSRDDFTRGYIKKKPTKRVSKFTLMSLFWEYDKLTLFLKFKREYAGAIKTAKRILELLAHYRKDDLASKVSALFTLAKLNRLSLKEEEARQLLAQIEQILVASKSHHVSYAIELYDELGLIEQQAGNQAEAKIHFYRAIQMEKTDGGNKSLILAQILFHLANSQYHLKNYEDARSCLEESLEIFKYHSSKPETYVALYQKLAEVALATGNREKSKDYILQGIVQLEEVFFPAYQTIASLYKQLAKMEHKDGNDQKAIAYYYKFYENQVIDPSEFKRLFINYFRRCELLARLGHIPYAKQYLEKALKLYEVHHLQDDKRLCSMYTLLGRCHTEMGNFSKAILYLNRALKLRPSWDIAIYSLAQVYEKRNKRDDYKKEKTQLEKLVSIHQENEVNEFLRERITEINHG